MFEVASLAVVDQRGLSNFEIMFCKRNLIFSDKRTQSVDNNGDQKNETIKNHPVKNGFDDY